MTFRWIPDDTQGAWPRTRAAPLPYTFRLWSMPLHFVAYPTCSFAKCFGHAPPSDRFCFRVTPTALPRVSCYLHSAEFLFHLDHQRLELHLLTHPLVDSSAFKACYPQLAIKVVFCLSLRGGTTSPFFAVMAMSRCLAVFRRTHAYAFFASWN